MRFLGFFVWVWVIVGGEVAEEEGGGPRVVGSEGVVGFAGGCAVVFLG